MNHKKNKSHFLSIRSPRLIHSKIEIKDGVMWYTYKNKKMFWDSMAFRPCLSSVFDEDKIYHVDIHLGKKNLLSGKEVLFPEKIIKSKTMFINIR